jgi:L-alanine-DL-glutamate epimerase-like enolase superfamily enzyme
MKLHYKVVETPFIYPFTISGGRTKTHQPALVVALELGPFMGFGEAPAIMYYNVSVDAMVEVVEKKKTQIEKFALTDPARYWHYLHHLLPNDPFLVAALDMAAWDLFGKMRKQPLYKLWGTEWTHCPPTDYTLGIDAPETMLEKMKANPWPIYKVKLGTSEDIEIIQLLRNHTNAAIRVDANAGWTTEEALEKLPLLHELGVELVEQPLAKDNWEGMKQLKEVSPIPLFADESCVFESDVARCAGHYHGINIKLTKCSGPTPALRMIEEAKKLGMQVMMGSMNENIIGSAAIAHFLPQLDFVDMDGPLLQTMVHGTGLDYLPDGHIQLSNTPGLGIQVKFPAQQS